MGDAVNHASLVVVGSGRPAKLDFTYNPETLTVSRQARWSEGERSEGSKPQRKVPVSQFLGSGPRTLSMQVFLDGWSTPTSKVWADVAVLMTWCEPTAESQQKLRPQPPVLILRWGSRTWFHAVLTSVTSQYTMFDASGDPVRAVVDLELLEVPVSVARQNPTSGGVAGRRSRVVVEGDTLPSIAYAEYGTAAVWRAVAEANGIDDPMRLRPGTRLLLTPPEEVLGA